MSVNITYEVADQARFVRILQKRWFKEHRPSTLKECLLQEHELDRLIELWNQETEMLAQATNATQPALDLPKPEPPPPLTPSDPCPQCGNQLALQKDGRQFCPTCYWAKPPTLYPVRAEG